MLKRADVPRAFAKGEPYKGVASLEVNSTGSPEAKGCLCEEHHSSHPT